MRQAVDHDEESRLAALYDLCLLDTPSDPVFDKITQLASKVFGVPVALISLVDAGRQWFKSRVGLDLSETPREYAFCGHAIHATKPMVVPDASLDVRFLDNPLVTGVASIRFYAGAPLRTREGFALGTLCIIDTVPRPALDVRDLEVLEMLAGLVMSRIETLRSIGFVDPLTALPNRERFIEDLRQNGWPPSAGAPQRAVAVDIGGVEYFRAMVKAFGWEYAEAYLVGARDRLRSLLPGVALYRIGITLYGYFSQDTNSVTFEHSARGLLAGFLPPITVAGIPNMAELAVGCVRFDHLASAAECVRAMLTTVDLAHQNGLGYAMYQPDDRDAPRRAFSLLSALSAALQANQGLVLHYQPKVDCRNGIAVGVEALLRWQHDQYGAVSPAEFIPLAERTALQRGLTRWVVEQALSQMARWRQHNLHIPLALNVSATDFDHADFVDHLLRAAQRHCVAPEDVMIEFTESILLRNSALMQAQLVSLRAHGFQLAIDDFGTGYSSLNYLKQLPAQVVKLDQSFIRTLCEDGHDRTIVPAVIQLSHDLGMRVVAEGVEDERTLMLLTSFGCDEVQGYLLARPMSAADMVSWWSMSRNLLDHTTGAVQG